MKTSLHQTNRKWDLFISYSRADNTNVRVKSGDKEIGIVDAFVKRLQESHIEFTDNPLQIFYDQNSINDDDDWSSKLREGVRDSVLFLAFLSPNYMKSKYCILEWKEYMRYQYANARGQNGVKQIYVVTIDELEAKEDPDFEHEQYEFLKEMRSMQRNLGIDIRNLAKDPEALSRELQLLDTQERLEDLIEPEIPKKLDFEKLDVDITQRLDGVFLAEIAEKYSRWPSVLKTFVGRSKEIRDLHQVATQSEIGVVGSVHGLGGQGKTALVSQYAHAFSGFYATGGRWLINCEGYETLAQAFDQLPTMLNYKLDKEQDALDSAARIAVHLNYMHTSMQQRSINVKAEWLKQRGEQASLPNLEERALIVLDNVDHSGLLDASILKDINGIGSWLSIIATTRLDVSELGARTLTNTVIVNDLPLEDRLALLRAYRHIPMQEEELAIALVKLSGGITILVEIIAATIKAEETIYKRRTLKETLQHKIDKLTNSGVFFIDEMSDKVQYEVRAKNRQLKLAYIVEDTLNSLTKPKDNHPVIAPNAGLILQYAAQFPPELIVEEWLYELLKAELPDLQEDEYEETLNILEGRRLITRSDTKPYTAKMHRDIRVYFTEIDNSHYNLDNQVKRLIELFKEKLYLFVEKYKIIETKKIWRPIFVELAFYFLKYKKLDANIFTDAIFDLVQLSNAEQEYNNISSAIKLLELLYNKAEDIYNSNLNSADAQNNVCMIQTLLGDFYFDRGSEGDSQKALKMYLSSLEVNEKMVLQNPNSAQVLNILSLTQNKLGDFYSKQGLEGDAEKALELYLSSLEANKIIAFQNRNSVEALRNVSITQEYLADFYFHRGLDGDLQKAFGMYLSSLEAREKITLENPNSTQAIRDLSIIQNKFGSLYLSRGLDGDLKEAFELYISSLKATEIIALEYPNSSIALRDLSISQFKLGDFYFHRGLEGDAEKALEMYLSVLEAFEKIELQNPTSAQALRDVSIGQDRLGDFYSYRGLEGDAEKALELYLSSLEAREKIAEQNPNSAQALRDVSVSQNKLGDFYSHLGLQGDAEKTLEMYVSSLEAREKIAEQNPNSAQALRDVSESQNKLGDFYSHRGLQGDAEKALEMYLSSLEAREKIAAQNPNSAQALRDVSVSQDRLGDFYSHRGLQGDAEKALHLFTSYINNITNLFNNNKQPIDLLHRSMAFEKIGRLYGVFRNKKEALNFYNYAINDSEYYLSLFSNEIPHKDFVNELIKRSKKSIENLEKEL